MRLIMIISVMSAIYFGALVSIYTQCEGRKAALMGVIVSIMFFIISIIYDNYEKNNHDSGSLG